MRGTGWIALLLVTGCGEDAHRGTAVGRTDTTAGGEAPEELSTGATCPTPPPTYETHGRAFFAQYCVSCHSSANEGDERHGAPEDVNFDTLAGIRAELEEIDERAAAGPEGIHRDMPRGRGPRPSESERRLLGQWLACGAPEHAPDGGPPPPPI